MEDVAIEGGDRGLAAGIVGRDGIGGLRSFVSGVMTLGVCCELLFPIGAAGRVGEFGTGLLDRGSEKSCVRLLLLGGRVGVGMLDDIGMCASVAGAEDDSVARRGATTDGRHRVSKQVGIGK